MEQRPIVDVDESGLALDALRDRDIVQKDRGARQVKVGMLENYSRRVHWPRIS